MAMFCESLISAMGRMSAPSQEPISRPKRTAPTRAIVQDLGASASRSAARVELDGSIVGSFWYPGGQGATKEDLKDSFKVDKLGIKYSDLDDEAKARIKDLDVVASIENPKEKKRLAEKLLKGEYTKDDVQNHQLAKDLGLDFKSIKGNSSEEENLKKTHEMLKGLDSDIKNPKFKLSGEERKQFIKKSMNGELTDEHKEVLLKVKNKELTPEDNKLVEGVVSDIQKAEILKNHADRKKLLQEFTDAQGYEDETLVDLEGAKPKITYEEIENLAKNGDEYDKKWAENKLKQIEKDYDNSVKEKMTLKQKERDDIANHLFAPASDGSPKRIPGPDGKKKVTLNEIYDMALDEKNSKNREWAASTLEKLKDKKDEVIKDKKDKASIDKNFFGIGKDGKPGTIPGRDGKTPLTSKQLYDMAKDDKNPEDKAWAENKIDELKKQLPENLEVKDEAEQKRLIKEQEEREEKERVEKQEKDKAEKEVKKKTLTESHEANKKKLTEDHDKEIQDLQKLRDEKKKKLEEDVEKSIKNHQSYGKIKEQEKIRDEKLEPLKQKRKDIEDEEEKTKTKHSDEILALGPAPDPSALAELEKKHKDELKVFETRRKDVDKEEDVINKDFGKKTRKDSGSLGSYTKKKEKALQNALDAEDLEFESAKAKKEKALEKNLDTADYEHNEKMEEFEPVINEKMRNTLSRKIPSSISVDEKEDILDDLTEELNNLELDSDSMSEEEIEDQTNTILENISSKNPNLPPEIALGLLNLGLSLGGFLPQKGTVKSTGKSTGKGTTNKPLSEKQIKKLDKEKEQQEETSMTAYFKDRTFVYEKMYNSPYIEPDNE
ncbi:MAG: hypothetical protein EBU84_13805, partial [Actinobacteria bacterium]|nr:hypothetical protein [Actinomycetota bacterium]